MTLVPDSFSLSPLLSLLPSLGSVARLEELVPSLFARYESVEALRHAADSASTDSADAGSADLREQLERESAMLKQILDWLEVQPHE